MNLPKVTIQMVTFNSLRFLPDCLQSIFSQTYRDFQVLVVDNNSQDGTINYLRKNYPEVAVFKNNKNVGFSKANNQGFKLLNSDLVVLCNPDIILQLDWLEKMMAAAANDKYKGVGSFASKLLRMKITGSEQGEVEKTKIIDSCGLKLMANHQVVELGAGQMVDEYEKEQEVFGVSGALVMYRRQALDDIFLKNKDIPAGEYFDEDLSFYKEDVDLAWRLQLMGWSSVLVPQAVAYHVRQFSAPTAVGIKGFRKGRKKQSMMVRYQSYRNHFLVVYKNQFKKNLFKYFSKIFIYEFKKMIYITFFEFPNLKAIFNFLKLYPKFRRKKKLIMSKAKVSAVEMRKWIN